MIWTMFGCLDVWMFGWMDGWMIGMRKKEKCPGREGVGLFIRGWAMQRGQSSPPSPPSFRPSFVPALSVCCPREGGLVFRKDPDTHGRRLPCLRLDWTGHRTSIRCQGGKKHRQRESRRWRRLGALPAYRSQPRWHALALFT